MLLRPSQMLLRQFLVLHCKQSALSGPAQFKPAQFKGLLFVEVASTAKEVRVLGGGTSSRPKGQGGLLLEGEAAATGEWEVLDEDVAHERPTCGKRGYMRDLRTWRGAGGQRKGEVESEEVGGTPTHAVDSKKL